jgi:predicted nucleic acid-binding protein
VIAADTSTWVAYLQGETGDDIRLLDRALDDRQVVLPPVVLAELLSDPKLAAEAASALLDLPVIDIEPGYWERAGRRRAKVLAKKRKARLSDALIAQSCLDRRISLLTRDRDFVTFAETADLDLVVPTS